MDVHELLLKVQNHEVDLASAEEYLKKLPYEDLGFAKLDHHRALRSGFGEVVYCAGKTTEHLVRIFQSFAERKSNVLGTRATKEQFAAVREVLPEAVYEELSRTIYLQYNVPKLEGRIAVCTGGTSDIPVAEEAALTAEAHGNEVVRLYDVGVAGLHRLLAHMDEIMSASVIIAIAGMEGALASVIGGLADCPVIAVPTSIGYGASFGGVSALLSMLNSCASGVSVVNIDNGFGAGYLASMINHMTGTESKK